MWMAPHIIRYLLYYVPHSVIHVLALTDDTGPVEEGGGGDVSEEGVRSSATMTMMMKMVVAMQRRRKTGRRSSQRSRRETMLALGRERKPRGRQRLDDTLRMQCKEE